MSDQPQEWTWESVEATRERWPTLWSKHLANAHNAALAAEREKSDDEARAFLVAATELRELLAAERQKVRERKAAADVLRAENRGLFAKCEALEEANKKFEIVILEGEGTVDKALLDENKQLRDQLAAEWKVRLQ